MRRVGIYIKIVLSSLIVLGDIMFLLAHQDYVSTIPDVFGCIILAISIWYDMYQILVRLPESSNRY